MLALEGALRLLAAERSADPAQAAAAAAALARAAAADGWLRRQFGDSLHRAEHFDRRALPARRRE